MNRLLLALSVVFCYLGNITHASQRYEAEDAKLSGGALIATSPLASGTQYVRMNGGNLTFTVSVDQAALYNLKVVYSQTYGETKTQNIAINGETSGSMVFVNTGNTLTFSHNTHVVRLKAGANTVAIECFWGWVDVDYIELSAYQKTLFNVDPHPTTPNPSEGAAQVYAFLLHNFQKKTISGVMTGDVLMPNTNTPVSSLYVQNEVKFVHNSSGKYPVIVGLDYLMTTGKDTDGVWFRAYTTSTMQMAEEIWAAGGIPTFSWHWRDPSHQTGEFYTDRTSFDLTRAFTDATCQTWNTSSAEYKGIIRDIDIIAGYLKKLRDKGVAVLWRPLHEASGGWFWWGAKGALPCKQLYRMMYNRMVITHGLNNLLWVWNADGVDTEWYPGADVVDILGRDYYYSPNQKNHSSLIGEFEAMKKGMGTSKMIALSENSSLPYPDNMIADGADWLYTMPWNGEHTNVYNNAGDWNLFMNHHYVITLDQMPGWNTSTSIIGTESKPQKVYTEAGRLIVTARSGSRVEVVDTGGRSILSLVMDSNQVDFDLQQGVYIVVVDRVATKVAITKQ